MMAVGIMQRTNLGRAGRQLLQRSGLSVRPHQRGAGGLSRIRCPAGGLLRRQRFRRKLPRRTGFEAQFSAFPTDKLNADQQADRDMVLSNIHSTLLELESIRMWEKNPDEYASTASGAAFTIMSRTFAPPMYVCVR